MTDYDIYERYIDLARSGDSTAQVKIGEYYLFGSKKDYDKAFKWFCEASHSNNLNAIYHLGRCYDIGLGVEQDTKKSMFYFMEAAKAGHKIAQFEIGNIFVHVKDFPSAIKYLELSAKQGYTDAISLLATIYLDGDEIEINYGKALDYIRTAIDMEDAYSMNLLGTMYSEGKGVEQDHERAFLYFKLASKYKYLYAFLNLADCYENGIGTEKNIHKAIESYAATLYFDCEDEIMNNTIQTLGGYAEQGFSDAQYYLSQIYVTEDKTKHLYLLMQSAQNGFAKAQYELGKYYETGISGVEENIETAIEWLEKAAMQGDEGAIYSVQYLRNPDLPPRINHAKYKYKGVVYHRKNFIFAVVKDYVEQHPEATLESLNYDFTVRNKSGLPFQFFRAYENINEGEIKAYRYFAEPIICGNGEKVAVACCSDFVIVNNFMKKSKEYGFESEVII